MCSLKFAVAYATVFVVVVVVVVVGGGGGDDDDDDDDYDPCLHYCSV
jgi:hypothetical protein